MICKPCRKGEHHSCTTIRVVEGKGGIHDQISPTWCDCQHVTEGVNINPEFKLDSPEGTGYTGSGDRSPAEPVVPQYEKG